MAFLLGLSLLQSVCSSLSEAAGAFGSRALLNIALLPTGQAPLTEHTAMSEQVKKQHPALVPSAISCLLAAFLHSFWNADDII